MTDPSNSSTPGAANPGPPPFDDPFVRFDARVLDPATAVRLPGGPAPTTTVYRGAWLLLTGPTADRIRELIAVVDAVAGELDLVVTDPSPLDVTERGADIEEHNRLANLLALAEQTGTPLVVPVRLRPTSDQPAPAVDVWPVLQRIRARGDAELTAAVGLDHLMFAAADIGGNPFTARGFSISGNPFTARGFSLIGGNPFTARGFAAGTESYLYAGSGGHGPVAVVMAEPRGAGKHHPHVVVLDTGVGQHPWFSTQPVQRSLTLSDGQHVGLDVSTAAAVAGDPEGAGAVADPMTGMLASHAGHGTFIAGLLRQTCPDATISGLRIMDADGVVPESTLTTALIGLGVKLAQEPGTLDALVLSLGYYAETAEDLAYTAGLRDLLLILAQRGVVTFVAAGNDSSQERCYPAGFADDPAFDDHLPLVAVAALNPDRTVALFSNDGPWVRGAAAGANVVSTAPVGAQGANQANVALTGPGKRRRGTIDPDNFSSGFATWSGTSFAAPVLAGRYLQRLIAEDCPLDVSARRALVPVRQK